MTIHRVPQRSEQWYALRCGRLTASCAADVLATGRGGAEAVARRDLRLRLACERLTGIPESEGYVSDEMKRGIEKEADAIAAYEARTGALVDTSVGFIAHDELMAGYSPDGLVADGLLEIKCPKTSTHLGYLKNPETLADRYRLQAYHALWITEAPWITLVSFDDRLPAALSLAVTTLLVNREVGAYALAATNFLTELDNEVAALEALKETA